MKRFKKELSWLLVVALVVSSLVVGLGQVRTSAANMVGTSRIRAIIHVQKNDMSCEGGGNDRRGTDSGFDVRFLNAGGGTVASFNIPDGPKADETITYTSPGQVTVNKTITQCQLIETVHRDEFCMDWIEYYYENGSNQWVKVAEDRPGGDSNQFNAVGDQRTVATTWFGSNVKTLTFNANGGSPNSTYDAIPYQTISAPGAPSRTGHTFTGWSGVPARMPNGNSTYYASWTVNTYYVLYNGNDATNGSMLTGTHVYDTVKALSPNEFSRTGYTFAGWATTAGGTSLYTDGQSVTNLSQINGGTVTLYAKWTAANSTITFDANGGTGGTQATTMPVNTALTAPVVTRAGYSFVAWSPSVPVVVPSTDRVYTAIWLADGEVNESSYNITFNSNGGSGTMDPQEIVFGQTAPLTSLAYTRTGYSFLGWATTQSVADLFGVEYADSENYIIGNSDVTLYAVWRPNNYLITFSANGGTNGNRSYITFGESLTAPSVVRTGYTFIGWSPSVPSTVQAGDSTYTAQWSANTYTVMYVGNGNTGGSMASSSHTYDVSKSLTGNGFTKTGYNFEGWATSAAGPVVYSNGEYISNLSEINGANVVLYAKWSLASYTITFDANGGTGGKNYSMSYGSTLTAPTVTRTGYSFVGWSPAVPSTAPAANTIYVAQWSANSYTITFDANGGTGGSTSTKTYGSSLTAPTVTRTNFTFDSWSPAVTSTVGARDVTYTAQWTEDTTWTITFNANGGTGGKSTVMTSGTALTAPTVTRAGYAFVSWYPTVPSTSPAADVTYTAQWRRIDYTINFDANGGSGGTSTVKVPGEALTAPTVTRAGYTFTGWSPAVPSTVPTANTTYTAQWSANSYTITFDADGGTGGTSKLMTCGSALSAPTVTRTGYTLASWTPTVPSTVPTTNTTYTAQWAVNTYSVTFNGNGGSTPAKITQNYDTIIDVPSSSRPGYIFEGWLPPCPTTMPANNTSCVAQWSQVTYTVAYDGNGADYGSMQASTHYENIANQLTANGFSRTGYTFDGWSLTPGGARFAPDSGSVTNVPGYAQGATVTLYAKWSPYTYTIAYDPGATSGIGGGPMDVSEATYDVPLTLSTNTFTRIGYTFIGWGPTLGGGVQYVDGDMVTNLSLANNGSVVLYAQWGGNPYAVHYNSNGGTGVTANSNHVYGTAKTLSPNGFNKTGYMFAGWATSAGGPKVYDDRQSVINLAQSGTFNLYAVWTANTYKIAYNQNSGTGQTMASTTHTWDTPSNLTANGYTKLGYTFTGWNTAVNGSGTGYADGTTILNITPTLNEVVTFYAMWQINQYTVIFDANGGAGGTAEALDYGSPLTPPVVTKEGNTFTGWIPPVPETVPASNSIYYAMWSPRSYPVTFDANGGTGGMSGFMVYGSELTPPVVAKAGHIFLGWSPEVPETVQAGTATYTAQWEAYIVTITFDANGGTGGTSGSMNCDTVLVAPADPTREGYIFAGWSPEVPELVPTQDTTYTAQWTPIDYTLTFDANGGTGSALPVTQGCETAVTLPTDGFEKTGYTFIGWNTQSGAVTALASYSMPLNGGTLYAIYTINVYTVIFDTDGGSLISPMAQDYATAIDSPADPVKPGYTFAGWTPDIPSTMPAEDTLCVAQWTINQFTVTFDANGGEGTADALTQDYNTSATLPTEGFAKLGYTFIGWNTEPDAAIALTDYNIPAEDATIYAIYIIDQYTVTFDSNGGSTVDAIVQDYATEITASADPSREGYTFAGWAPAIPATMPAKDIECVAQWTINDYTVSFHSNGGSAVGAITQEYSTAITPPTDPTRPGYIFVGWVPAIPAAMLAENIECLAQWELAGPVTLTVNDTVAAAGDEVIISVSISANSGLAAADVYLAFDNTKLSFVDATDGTAVAGGMSDIFEQDPVGNTTKIKQSFVHLDGITAEGTLMQITFNVLPGWMGSTPLELILGDFVENSLIPLETIKQNGSVTSTTSIITFDSDGGTAVSTMIGNEGDALVAPNAPEKVGYTFASWSPTLPAVYPVNGLDVIALWTVNQYTVSFDANGGEGSVEAITQDYNTAAILPNEGFAKTGHAFIGWNTSPNAETTMSGYIIPAEDTVLYAIYAINQYTVIFDASGGTASDNITQDYATEITTLPADPSREGHTFAGWIPAIPATMPAEDTVCFAQWTVNQYAVSFDTTGGTVVEPIVQDYATEIIAPADPVREGHIFAGWTPEIPATMPVDGTVCVAQWTVNSYTVSFDSAGGTAVDSISQDYATEITAPTDPSKEGYTFAGWSPAVPAVMPDRNIECIAQWQINQYTVSFDANGGEGTAEVFTQNFATDVSLPGDGFEKTGYNFLGWHTDPNAEIALVSYTVPADDSILYAIYGIHSYTVSFDANGGEGGTSATMEFGAELMAPVVTKEGYTFDLWSPEVPATVQVGNVTYTAQWQTNQYTVSFDADGGTAVDSITQDYATEITAPTDPSKEGYTFAGWSPTIPDIMPAEDTVCVAQWTINSYTFSFDSAGGTAVDSITQEYATNITAPADPTKVGNTFAGWLPTIPSTMPADDTVCVAQWTINQYTVSFNSMGDTVVDSITQDYATDITAPAAPTRAGYTFEGWTPAIPATMPDEDTVCVAQWTINSYTVSFDSAGGTAVDSITQEYATSITAPADPSREGYAFTGWVPAVPAVMPAENIECVAQWQINQYTVSFDANGGIGEVTAITQDYAGAVTLPEEGFAKTGYTFIGWNTDLNAVEVITSYSIPAEDTVLYAIYTINQYTVSFNANGGEGETEAVTQDYATVVTLPPSGFTKIGYTFIGWNTDLNAEEAITSYSIPAEDTVLYALYAINRYTVSFDANGGTAVDSITQDYATDITATADPTKVGYTFAGWKPEIPETMPAVDTVCDAQWTINSYTVSFDSNGGTAVDSITQNYAAEITAPADPSREGFTFTGWIPAVPTVMAAENIECVAQWTINSYTVTFDANGGEGGTSETMEYSAELTAPIVTRVGYTFTGWSPEVAATVQADDSVYTAQWQINQYTVTFDANGGEGTAETLTQDYTTAVALPSEGFAKTGYTFIGWNTNSNAEVTITSYSIPAEDTILYAIYIINQYTVSFDADGGTTVDSITQDYATEITAPADPIKTGYTFNGWLPTVPTIMPAENAECVAQWTINEYTISFDSTGGTAVDSITQDYATVITAPAEPTREGYTFTGWSPAVPVVMAAKNTVCVAQWAINQYYITFDANGGEGGTEAEARVFGIPLAAPVVTRTGYTFAGWSPDVPATVPADNVTYTAQWTINQHTVSFDSNGGSAVDAVTQDYGTEITAPADPTKEGYTFTGWSPAVPVVVAAENTVCVAQWVINQYYITFDANGGEGGAEAAAMVYGTPLAAPVVTRTGYTFTGWSPEVPSTSPAVNTTYTAQWSVNEYSITFNANGGTGGTGPTLMNYGAALTAPPVSNGSWYTLSGWSPVLPSTVPALNTTFTAQWVLTQYSVTFDPNGGVGGTTLALTKDQPITLPSVPTREGYTFGGWSPAVLATLSIPGDKIYVAQWNPKSVTITFDANGGIGGTSGSKTVGTALTAPTVTKAGFVFTGWSPAVPATVPTVATTYTAQWVSAATYTITFDANGGTGGTSQQLVAGTSLTAPQVLKPGYTFSSWSPTVPSTSPAANTTYTAQWTINQYTVSFESNGGSAVSQIMQNYGTAVAQPTAPTKTGNTFAGWYSDTGLTNAVTWPYTLGTLDVTFYAKWTPVAIYAITFDANGGTGGTSQQLAAGTTLTAPVVTRTGYTFSGWSPAVPQTVPAANTTYVAQWATALAAPTGLTSPGKTDTTVSLTWDTVADALSYNVYCDGQKMNTTGVITVNNYTISGLNPDTTYAFTVTAANSAAESPHSNTLNVTTNGDIADLVQITVSNASGTPGTEIQVTISISPDSNAAGIQLSFPIDTSIFEYLSATKGVLLTEGFAQIYFNANANSLNMSWVSTESLTEGGTILTINLKIRPEAEHQAVQTQMAVLAGDSSTNPLAVTVNQGSIQIGVLGDINADNSVNIFDVLTALSATTEEIILTENQRIAADVNRDNIVNIFDVLLLLRYTTGELVAF